MYRLLRSVDDPMMWKLVALMQEQLPDADRQARVRLLERLYALEREVVEQRADPGTLRSILATQDFVRRGVPLIGVHVDDRHSRSLLEIRRSGA